MPLRGPLTKVVATCCIARFLVLAAESSKLPIINYIASSKGIISEGLTVISTMSGIRCPIVTFSAGHVGGPAVAIAAHGTKGFRVASPDAHFSFKELSLDRPAKDAASYEFSVFAEVLARDTGKTMDEVLAWLQQGTEFNADEALKAGLIDFVGNQPIFPDAV